MATFKQSQIRPGVTKNRSNAIKVYVASAVAENDIIVATGMQGDFLSVEPADHTDISKSRGPFFVADYAAAAGEYTALAVPSKTITGKDTSTAAQTGDAVYLSTGGDVTLGALPAVSTHDTAFKLNVRVGRVTKVHASEGAYVLEPGVANGAPLIGRSLGNSSANVTALVTGFTPELAGAPCFAQIQGDSDRSLVRIFVHTDGKLTMEFSDTVDASDIINYMVVG